MNIVPKPILVLHPDSVGDNTMSDALNAGYLPVIAKEPWQVRVLMPDAPENASAILKAAIGTIACAQPHVLESFGRNLFYYMREELNKPALEQP